MTPPNRWLPSIRTRRVPRSLLKSRPLRGIHTRCGAAGSCCQGCSKKRRPNEASNEPASALAWSLLGFEDAHFRALAVSRGNSDVEAARRRDPQPRASTGARGDSCHPLDRLAMPLQNIDEAFAADDVDVLACSVEKEIVGIADAIHRR